MLPPIFQLRASFGGGTACPPFGRCPWSPCVPREMSHVGYHTRGGNRQTGANQRWEAFPERGVKGTGEESPD